MTDLVIWVCEECGSKNVTDYAIVRWDVNAQDWRVVSHDCQDHCEDCQDDSAIVERPLNLKEIAQLAIKKQEIINASNPQ